MSDRRIQVFHAVAKHLSFTKAAEALFMTQPAVTFQIRQLEEEFNTRLFDRRRGRVTLTAAGAIALEYSEGIVALSAELKTRMKELGGAIGGPLLVGASTTLADFLLPQIIADFKAPFSGDRFRDSASPTPPTCSACSSTEVSMSASSRVSHTSRLW
jgi:DNA-binding transcriptional LysR family regulator